MMNSGKLKVTTPTDREIVMTRVFNAPRRLVFAAITKPELVKRWLTGPPGWTMPVCEIDAKVGGAYRFLWHGPDGAQLGTRGICRECVPPERFVATERFDDPWYPGEALVTYNLAEEANVTTVTLTVRYESREARDGVLRTPMDKGVGMSYDLLEELLLTLPASELEKGAGKS